ncbi:MAG: 50S ribosomal protein L30 [Dehalococcoidia bacterium]|nr:50S ribosomal protein L30 [Dehalococcoidia bacterium]
MAKLMITWVKSDIGYAKDQKQTIKALGLRRLNQSVKHEDTPTIRGMALKVKHLVRVEEVEE